MTRRLQRIFAACGFGAGKSYTGRYPRHRGRVIVRRLGFPGHVSFRQGNSPARWSPSSFAAGGLVGRRVSRACVLALARSAAARRQASHGQKGCGSLPHVAGRSLLPMARLLIVPSFHLKRSRLRARLFHSLPPGRKHATGPEMPQAIARLRMSAFHSVAHSHLSPPAAWHSGTRWNASQILLLLISDDPISLHVQLFGPRSIACLKQSAP